MKPIITKYLQDLYQWAKQNHSKEALDIAKIENATSLNEILPFWDTFKALLKTKIEDYALEMDKNFQEYVHQPTFESLDNYMNQKIEIEEQYTSFFNTTIADFFKEVGVSSAEIEKLQLDYLSEIKTLAKADFFFIKEHQHQMNFEGHSIEKSSLDLKIYKAKEAVQQELKRLKDISDFCASFKHSLHTGRLQRLYHVALDTFYTNIITIHISLDRLNIPDQNLKDTIEQVLAFADTELTSAKKKTSAFLQTQKKQITNLSEQKYQQLLQKIAPKNNKSSSRGNKK